MHRRADCAKHTRAPSGRSVHAGRMVRARLACFRNGSAVAGAGPRRGAGCATGDGKSGADETGQRVEAGNRAGAIEVSPAKVWVRVPAAIELDANEGQYRLADLADA